jgi:cytochrome P450
MTIAAMEIPSHISPAHVFDFDFVDDPLLKPDPHKGLLELQKLAPPIFFTPRYGGHWIAQSHQAIFDISHDADLFSSDMKIKRQHLPIGADPPDHRDYRRALLGAFAPKTVNAILPMIREMTVDLIEKVRARGSCQFVDEVSEPLPVIIFMKMLGLPLEHMAELRRLIVKVLDEGDVQKREEIFSAQLEILDTIIVARMEKREDDMLSRILDSNLGDRRATFEEVQSYLLLLTNAGLDTVTNAMSFGMMHLAKDQALQAQVRADPTMVDPLIEEFLRRYAVSSILRRVSRNAEFAGVSLRAEDRVHLLVQSANLDSAVYPEPDKVILGREEPPVTFGTGIHRCLGSHLARLELRNMMTEWLARIPQFRLDPDRPPRMHAGFVYTVDELPLLWEPES